MARSTPAWYGGARTSTGESTSPHSRGFGTLGGSFGPAACHGRAVANEALGPRSGTWFDAMAPRRPCVDEPKSEPSARLPINASIHTGDLSGTGPSPRLSGSKPGTVSCTTYRDSRDSLRIRSSRARRSTLAAGYSVSPHWGSRLPAATQSARSRMAFAADSLQRDRDLRYP